MKGRVTRRAALLTPVAILLGTATIHQYSVASCPSPIKASIQSLSSSSYHSLTHVLRLADLHNQNYTWWGNQWMVPAFSGIPVFSQYDMLLAFSHVNTLWIGDSTTRRAYATMYSILNHTTTACSHDGSSCSHNNSTASISIDELNHPKVIDVNKRGYLGIIDESSCKDRRIDANSTYYKPGMHELWDNHALCRTLPNTNRGEQSRRTGALFDFAKVNCFQELHRISKLENELKRYSVIIIGLGLHDAIRRYECAVPKPKVKIPLEELKLDPRPSKSVSDDMPLEDVFRKYGWKGAEDISTVLQRVHDADGGSGQNTAVFWRTTGFSAAANAHVMHKILNMNQDAKTLVTNHTTHRNGSVLGIIDWGTVIFPRSYPPNRISGDILEHYGLEARLLMAQMATQQVFRFLLGQNGTDRTW